MERGGEDSGEDSGVIELAVFDRAGGERQIDVGGDDNGDDEKGPWSRTFFDGVVVMTTSGNSLRLPGTLMTRRFDESSLETGGVGSVVSSRFRVLFFSFAPTLRELFDGDTGDSGGTPVFRFFTG